MKSWAEITDTDLADYPARSATNHPVPETTRPGTGIRTPGCGQDRTLKCNDCGHTWTVSWDCMSRYCPHCYTLWADREARSARDKVKTKKTKPRIVHAVVSVPGQPEDIWRLRPMAYEIAKRHGIEAGAVAPHAWRDHGQGWVADGYCHYHVVGQLANGRFRPGEANMGYIFKVIKNKKGSYYVPLWALYYHDKRGNPKGVLYYMLEHAAVQHGRHALTWFGAWWRTEDGSREPDLGGEVATPKPESCPKCGSGSIYSPAPVPEPFHARVQSRWDADCAKWRAERSDTTRERAETVMQQSRKRGHK